MKRSVWALTWTWWGLCLVSCGYLPAGAGPDGGVLYVPQSYYQARMTPGHREHLQPRGDKQVYCRDCHALADGGFTAPSLEVCGQCHREETVHHHPFDAGTPMGCLSCHVFKAREDTERFEKWGCLSCHGQRDGGGVAVHTQNCASCHRPHQEPFTQAADCSSCHSLTVQHGAQGETMAETCMSCHPHHTAAVVASDGCIKCHAQAKIKEKSRVAPTALFSPGHPGCGTCHQAHTFRKGAIQACTQCHRDKPVLAQAAHEECTDCHRPHRPRAEAQACIQCHSPKTVVKHPPDAQGRPCVGCHPVHQADVALAQPCTQCHAEARYTAEVVHAVTTDCDACHAPHAAKPARETLCIQCHEAQVVAVKKNRAHSVCGDCHDGLPHGVSVSPKACLSCHDKSQPPQPHHATCENCHASHSAAVTKTCADCHLKPGTTLPGLHAEKKHQECNRCHAPHVPEPGIGPKTCQSCHRRLSLKEHPTAPTQCVGCHLFKSGSPDL